MAVFEKEAAKSGLSRRNPVAAGKMAVLGKPGQNLPDRAFTSVRRSIPVRRGLTVGTLVCRRMQPSGNPREGVTRL
jgi:hypothetical protein